MQWKRYVEQRAIAMDAGCLGFGIRCTLLLVRACGLVEAGEEVVICCDVVNTCTVVL